MFDPTQLSSSLAPGDKISMTFHKAKADPQAGGSFIQNAQNAGLVPAPQGMATPAPAGGAPAMAGGAPDQRSMLVAAMRRRFGLA